MSRSSTTTAKSTSATEGWRGELMPHKTTGGRRYHTITEVWYPDPRSRSGGSVALFRSADGASAFAKRHAGSRVSPRRVDSRELALLRKAKKLEY